MNFDGDTVTHGWVVQRGPIHLRHTERKLTTSRDVAAFRGILVSVLIGVNLIVWFVALSRLLP